jgi:hypothetical protein
MNLETFFRTLNGTPAFPALTTAQVRGMTRLLDVWGQWYAESLPFVFLAAALAEVHHETGGRMMPVMETFSSTAPAAANKLQVAFDRGQLPWVEKPYWGADKDGKIWIGRGDVQITHKEMYAKLRKLIKETYSVDIKLDVDPELALDPVISAVIAFEGMTRGAFRGKKLADFYNDKTGEMDYAGQRNVVNGDSKDPEIAKKMKANGALFEKALREAGADKGITPTVEKKLPGMDKTIAPSERPATVPTMSKGEVRVAELQLRLHRHGYGDIVGKIDGIYGAKTAKAVDAFESSRNIKLDHVDAATWQALQQPAAGENRNA